MPEIIVKKDYKNRSWKDKHNPDFEKKKQSVIVNHDDNSQGTRTVRTSAGDIVFERGMAVLPNDGRAEDVYGELQQHAKHRDQFALVRGREGMKRDNTHPMRVTTIALPWKEYDERGRVIGDKNDAE